MLNHRGSAVPYPVSRRTTVPYSPLAEIVLVLHFAVVLFVVGGLLAVLLGNALHWRWVNQWWFRLLHLCTIAYVVMQSWFGITCPLTTLESWLREQAGQTRYQQSFIEHWVQSLLFYQAPFWLFATAYSVFGALVVVTWWRFPPRRSSTKVL